MLRKMGCDGFASLLNVSKAKGRRVENRRASPNDRYGRHQRASRQNLRQR
jgi:hypothetical protein